MQKCPWCKEYHKEVLVSVTETAETDGIIFEFDAEYLYCPKKKMFYVRDEQLRKNKENKKKTFDRRAKETAMP